MLTNFKDLNNVNCDILFMIDHILKNFEINIPFIPVKLYYCYLEIKY